MGPENFHCVPPKGITFGKDASINYPAAARCGAAIWLSNPRCAGSKKCCCCFSCWSGRNQCSHLGTGYNNKTGIIIKFRLFFCVAEIPVQNSSHVWYHHLEQRQWWNIRTCSTGNKKNKVPYLISCIFHLHAGRHPAVLNFSGELFFPNMKRDGLWSLAKERFFRQFSGAARARVAFLVFGLK